MNYYLNHPKLTIAQAVKNLSIGKMKRNLEQSFRGSRNNSSDEAKEIVHLKLGLKDAQDDFEILLQQSAYWAINLDYLLVGDRKS